MNLLHKTILILIASSIFIFLIFVTFITNSLSSFEKPFYENTKEGLYELVKSNDSYLISNKTSGNTGTIFLNQLNTSDKVLFSYGTVETKYSSGNILINLTPGIYFFQLKEINSNYIISGEGFEITNKGPGKFIINNLNPRKILTFSINTLIGLQLNDPKTNEKITDISLYPHKYLVFNPLKSIFVKNSDLLKIDQTFTLGYFNGKIENSDSFIDLITLRNEKGKELIKSSLEFYKNEIQEKEEYIKNYINNNFGILPGEKIIAKYFELFINSNKKSLYYKNLIIRDINQLLQKDTIDNISINEINKTLQSLKLIDDEGAKEMIDFITFYYTNIIISDSSINSKINFSKLLNKINNKNNPSFLISLIYLEKIFNNYGSNDFYSKINEFTNKYFEDLNISIDGKDKNKGSINEVKNIDYLLYFLENIMINSNSSSENTLGDIVNIFNNYVNISNSFYSYSSDEIKRVGLFTNSKILNKFVKMINENYFIDNGEADLLEIKEGATIIKKDIELLEKNINNIFSFFENNKIVLNINKSAKDKFLDLKIYPNLIKKYKEYFYALKDYEEYLAIYDTSKKELLTTNSINEVKNTITLSIDTAKEYIQSFKSVQFIDTNITIMDYTYCLDPTKENEKVELLNPYCYKIDNLIIDRQVSSFILYPLMQNKIDNIIIDGVPKSGTYKLTEIKNELYERLKTAKTDKELYKFENFLLNTFGRKLAGSSGGTNNVIEDTKIEQEDPVIRIFKRNKLLGNVGDFANIEGTIDVAYDNLDVEKKGKSYSIYIDSAKLFINITKNESYRGLFSSNYNFSEKHSFINPSIKLLEKKSERYLLLGNIINITGEYKVNNIEKELKELFNGYKELNYSVIKIAKLLNNNKINISYSKESKSFTLNTLYNGKEVNIQLQNGNIIKALYDSKSILENKLDYESINYILNKITN